MGPWHAEERRQKPPKVLPLASREGSDQVISGAVIDAQFQSTLPAGEATSWDRSSPFSGSISIHASRKGSDRTLKVISVAMFEFQSTPPAGEATISAFQVLPLPDFNPRFPQGKRLQEIGINSNFNIFQSTLTAREATFTS